MGRRPEPDGGSVVSPRIVVAGGGLAGITAALACADAGAEVTLLEARARLGGATHSFRRHGLRVDNGQHVFLRCCTAYRALLERVGSSPLTQLQPRLDIPVLAPGRRAGLRRDELPAPLHLARALARYPLLSPRDRLRAVPAALALSRLDPTDPALDRRTFGDWLEERRQSPRAVEALWDLIGLPTLNLPAREASLALAVKVFRTGLLDERSAADIGIPRAPLGVVHGEAAARALAEAGAEVRLRAPVRGVHVEGGRVRGVETEEGLVETDAVILATPPDAAAALVPPESGVDEAALGRLGTSPIVNVHVVYDRRVTDLDFAAAVGTPVQWVFDRTGPSGLEEGQYLAISLSGARQYERKKTEELRSLFLPALELLFPAAAAGRVRTFFVTRERAATFRQAPGSASLRPGPRTRVPGLVLAGAWTDTGWPATMEGAVRSGRFASRVALEELGEAPVRPEEVAV